MRHSKKRKGAVPAWQREQNAATKTLRRLKVRSTGLDAADSLTPEYVAAIINPQLLRITQCFPENFQYPYPKLHPFSSQPIEENEIFSERDKGGPFYRTALLLYLSQPEDEFLAKKAWHKMITWVTRVVYPGELDKAQRLFADGILSAAGQNDLTADGILKIKTAGQDIFDWYSKCCGDDAAKREMHFIAEQSPKCFHRNIDIAWDGIGGWQA